MQSLRLRGISIEKCWEQEKDRNRALICGQFCGVKLQRTTSTARGPVLRKGAAGFLRRTGHQALSAMETQVKAQEKWPVRGVHQMEEKQLGNRHNDAMPMPVLQTAGGMPMRISE